MHFGHGDACVVKTNGAVAPLEPALEAYEVHRRRADEIGDEHAVRPVVDLLRRGDLLDDPLVHDQDPVGHRHRFELVMSDVDGGRSDPVVKVTQLIAHKVAEFGVERAERLVHEKSLRPAYNGAAKGDALPVAARELRNLAREKMLDPQQPRRLAHLLADLIASDTLAPQRKPDVLGYVHVRIEGEELEDEGDVALRRATKRDILAIQQNLALGWQLEAGDHAQRRRLPASRGPQHDE